ncbi:MAG: amino acid adenylation domain-containing protein, partial [Planctomycetota bacterium]
MAPIKYRSLSQRDIENQEPLELREGESDIAYIIYTSGSTGEPKGVMITHDNVSNFLTAMADTPGITPQDRLLAVTTVSFDISVLELFLPLVSSATVVLAGSDAAKDGSELCRLIDENAVTIMQATPATWRLLLESRTSHPPDRSLRVLCGGEALSASLAKQLLEYGREVWNLYGPTETTVWSAALRLQSRHISRSTALIGRPILNTRLRVVDRYRRDVPVGCGGELLIGGRGVSPGYWERPELSADKFQDGWYATGDFVRWLEDGSIEFMERTDHQIKLRGFRIELGEIEAAIEADGTVAEAAAVVVPGQCEADNRLVAFLRWRDSSSGSGELDQLRDHLKQHLPAHMLPAQIEVLDEFPRTLNGKADHGALVKQATEPKQRVDESKKQGSMHPREEMVAGIWLEVLGRSHIDRNDHFFEIGGHSLAAARVIARVEQTFNLRVSLKSLFENPKLEDFVASLDGKSQAKPTQIPRLAESLSRYPLSDAQRRQWLMDQLLPESPLYSVPTAARIRGPLSISRLRQSLQRLSQQHDVLRMTFDETDGEPFAIVHESVDVPLELRELGSLSLDSRESEVNRQIDQQIKHVFDLRTAPLWSATLFRLSRQGEAPEHVLLFSLHHILIDGWSIGLLVRDLVRLYNEDQTADLVQQGNLEFTLPLAGGSDAVAAGEGSLDQTEILRSSTDTAEPNCIRPPTQPSPDKPLTGRSSPTSQGEEETRRRLRYTDFAVWQKSQDYQADLEYWKTQLAGLPPRLDFPTDFQRPSEPSLAGRTHEFEIDDELLSEISGLSRKENATLFMMLVTGFFALLYRYSGVQDLAVGTPVANRPHRDLEDVVGLFVNTMVLRTLFEGDPTVRELLKLVRGVTLDAHEHQQAPFEQVIDAVGAVRSRSHSPLFQVLFTLQNAPLDLSSSSGTGSPNTMTWKPFSIDARVSKFDLSLSLRQESSRLLGRLEYRTDLFRRQTIKRLASHYVNLMRAMSRDPTRRLSTLAMLDVHELEQLNKRGQVSFLPSTWRVGPQADQTQEKRPDPFITIHECFVKQARETPERVALWHARNDGESSDWTYREVDRIADQWADRLRSLGVGLETRVGILSERSPQSIVALIAILKAGGAYVSLDYELPQSRLQWLAGDALCDVVLGHDADLLRDAFPRSELQLLDQLTDGMWISKLKPPNNSPSQNAGERTVEDSPEAWRSSASNLAYISYTSGSTGTPKGVCVPHRGVIRLVRETNYASFNQDDVFLHAAPLGFDASTFEIWGPLLSGGSLVLPPEDHPSLDQIADLVERHGVTTLWLTAGLFHAMVDEGLDQRLTSVRQLIAGGDVLSMRHLTIAQRHLPATQFINGYGPTEGTTFTCCHRFANIEKGSGLLNAENPADDSSSGVRAPVVPIGVPVSGTIVYVLDRDLQPVPVGVPGELYLGGLGLARGYLNDPRMTAERLLPNPFFDIRHSEMTDEATTLYRTGDRVRYRDDGVIEFLGRVDEQLKIRGFRIEPGESEHALKQHQSIRDAIVTAINDPAGRKHLVAYLLSTDEENPRQSSSKLRQFLSQCLPAHLIPTKFQWLQRFPLSVNGKVDRAALPSPEWSALDGNDDRDPTDVEATLLAVWNSLLPSSQVGLHDNFFE